MVGRGKLSTPQQSGSKDTETLPKQCPGDPLSPTGPILQFLPPSHTPVINSLVDLSIDQVRTLASDTALSPTLIISAQLGLGWEVGNGGRFTSKPEQKEMHLLRLE